MIEVCASDDIGSQKPSMHLQLKLFPWAPVACAKRGLCSIYVDLATCCYTAQRVHQLWVGHGNGPTMACASPETCWGVPPTLHQLQSLCDNSYALNTKFPHVSNGTKCLERSAPPAAECRTLAAPWQAHPAAGELGTSPPVYSRQLSSSCTRIDMSHCPV